MLKLKRAYDPVAASDGRRFLVERLWPRGVSSDRLHVERWLKDVGPSTELRQWYGHDPLKWPRFRARYFRELDAHPEAWRPIVEAARRGTVTLVYSSRETLRNSAVALREYLNFRLRGRASPGRAAAVEHRSSRHAARRSKTLSAENQ